MSRSTATAFGRGSSTTTRASLLVSLLSLLPLLLHAQTWNGSGTTDKWSNTANWSTNVAPVANGLPVFAGTVRLTPVNDLTSGLALTGITFTNTAGAFVITGNAITLGGDMTDNSTTQINYNAPIILNASLLRNFNILSSSGELVVGAVISGTTTAAALVKTGRGALTFTAANTYAGSTDIQDGLLTLSGASGSLALENSFSIENGATLKLLNSAAANNTNRLADTQGITLNSGKLQFSQTGGAANYSETLGTLTLAGGINTLTTSQADPGQTSTLTLASLVRTGGVINFSGTGLGDDTRNRIVFTAGPDNDGIIGGYATVGLDFAKYDTVSGSVRSLQAGDYVTTDEKTWISSSNVKLTSGLSLLTTNRQINSLNAAATASINVNLNNDTLRVESGGIMASGSSSIAFQHGTLTAGEGSNVAGNVILHQNSSVPLVIGARITNNGTGVVSLTKAGTGDVVFTEASTYTGATQIYTGIARAEVTNALPTTTTLTMGDSSGTSASLDMTGVSQTVAGLSVVGNTTASHLFTVTAGGTLTVNGAMNVGANVALTVTNTTFNGGGTLAVNNVGGVFQLGLAVANIDANSATLDLSNLSSFTLNLGTTGTATTSLLRIGDNNTTSANGTSTFKLAASSTITANRISIGGETGNSGVNQTMSLGSGTTVINTNILDLGGTNTTTGSRGIGVINFATSTGTLSLHGTDGTSAVATMNLGYATLATTTGGPGASFDSRGHQADILVGTLNLAGRGAGSSTGVSTATFDFDTGTLGVTTLNIGQKFGVSTATSTTTGTMTLGGGIVNLGAVSLGGNTTASGGATGILTISGGTVSIASIAMASASSGGTATASLNWNGGVVTLGGAITRTGGAGTSVATLSLNGATLDMKTFAIGGTAYPVTLTAQSGILKNVGTINGTGGLTKSGTGILELQGNNAYTGATTITAGVLKVGTISDGGAASTLGSSASDAAGLVLNGGTLQYTGGMASSNRLFSVGTTAGSALDASGTGPLTLGGTGSIGLVTPGGTRTLTLTGTNAGDNILAASLGDDGANASSLTKTGTGTWALTGTHTYTGATTVNAGTLRLDFSGTGAPASNIIGGSSALALGGGTLDVRGLLSGTETQTFASLALNSGASTLSVAQNGATSLTVNLNGASIARTSGATLNFVTATTGSFTSTNSLNNSGGILGGFATFNGTDWATRDGAGNIVAYSAYIALPTSVIATGTNYSIATGQSQIGATTVNSLKMTGNGGVLGTGAYLLTVTGAGGGLLYAPTSATNSYSITGTGVVGAGPTNELIVTVNQGTLNIANPVASSSATAASLTKAGAGTLVLTGTSAFTGQTTVNSGTLEISGSGTVSSSIGNVVVASGGTLRVNSTNAIAQGLADSTDVALEGVFEVRSNETMGGLSGSGTVRNNGTINATLTVGNGNETTSFTGVLQDGSTGTLGLTKSGTGTLTLSGGGSSTNTGTTTITSGTLILAKTGGGIALSGNVIVGDGTGSAADALQLTGSEQIANGAIVTITGSATAGAGGVFHVGGNTETIGGLSSAGTTVTNGTVDNGASGTTGKLILNTVTDQDFSGVIQNGTGAVLALTKTGSAQQTLSGSGNNTYSGTTSVLGGVLRLNKTAGVNAIANALVVGDGTASAVVLWVAGNQIADTVVPVLTGSGATAGILRLGGRVETIGGLSSSNAGGGIVENDSGLVGTGTLTVSVAANTTQTFTGFLRDGDGVGTDGTLAFVKSGTGVQVITGNNTHSGGTTISSGTLVIGNGGATGSFGGGAVVDNGMLVLNRTGTLGFSQAITGTGSLMIGGGVTLTLSGNASTYSGDTIIDQGVLVAANTSGSATGTGTVYVASSATLAGAGLVGGAVTVNVGGTLQVGNLSGDTTGKVLQINGSLGSLGTLAFDLWTDDHGTNARVNADILKFGGSSVGTFSLGGTLTVAGNAINNWQAGDQWLLIDWGSIASSDRNAAFATLNLPALPSNLMFNTSALGTTGYLSIQASPEPGRALLCLLGLTAMMLLRRRV